MKYGNVSHMTTDKWPNRVTSREHCQKKGILMKYGHNSYRINEMTGSLLEDTVILKDTATIMVEHRYTIRDYKTVPYTFSKFTGKYRFHVFPQVLSVVL